MAGQSKKKGLQRREEAAKTYAYPAILCTLVCLVLRFGWAWESVTNWTWVCFATTLLFLYISYNSILHGTEEGTDHEFYLDMYKITLTAQVLATYSDLAWWLLVLVPLIGLYMMRGILSAFCNCCSRSAAQPAEEVDSKTQAKRRRREEKRGKGKIKYSRR